MEGNVGESGFTIEEINTKIKYFDVYSSTSTQTSYKNRILGDATGELGPFGTLVSTGSDGNKKANINSFFSGSSNFVNSAYSWVYRGGSMYHGVIAGPTYFGRDTGALIVNISFRMVLAK